MFTFTTTATLWVRFAFFLGVPSLRISISDNSCYATCQGESRLYGSLKRGETEINIITVWRSRFIPHVGIVGATACDAQ